MRIIVECQQGEDPDLASAPATVVVRPADLCGDDVQQLRRVLHALVTTPGRTVVVDLSDVCALRRTNVIAVLVGAAREARTARSALQVAHAPADGRRALFVAGVEEVAAILEPAYEVVIGTLAAIEEPVAV